MCGTQETISKRMPRRTHLKKMPGKRKKYSQIDTYFHVLEASLPTHIFSLSEAAVKEAHENERAALFAHNRDFLMRTYPSGIRVNSSNLDPSFNWRQGVQVVALNWQNCDKGMMLNRGMFAGTNGWVLKPPEYRGTAWLAKNPPLEG